MVMLEMKSLSFVLGSLGLKNRDVAKALETTDAHISGLCNGKFNASLGFALRLDSYLKNVWVARQGQTVPPEVAEIVFNLLYPPPPFNPFDGKSRRARRYQKAAQGFSSPVKNTPAQVAEPAASKQEHAHAQDPLSHTHTEPDSHRADATEPAAQEPLTGSAVGAGSADHRQSGQVRLPDDTRERTEVTGETGGGTTVLTEAYSSPAKNTPIYQFSCYQDAIAAYRELQIHYTLAKKKALYAAVKAHFAPFAQKSDNAIQKKLSYDSAIRIRSSAGSDPDIAKRRKIIADVIGPAFTKHRKENTHSKGAYATRCLGSRRKTLEAVLDTPQIAGGLKAELGILAAQAENPKLAEFPSLEYCLSILREIVGNVDARSEHLDHLQRTIGWRPRFCGEVICADYTGFPVWVDGAHDELPEGVSGNKRGFQKHGLHTAVDVGSAYTWLRPTFRDNEFAEWPEFLRWLYFEQLDWAPPFIVVDQVSGVWKNFHSPRVGDDGFPALHPNVLAIPAIGSQPYVHQPERATGNAHIETANRIVKDEATYLSVKSALTKELSGHGLTKARKFNSQLEYTRFIGELRERAAKRFLARGGDTRENLLACPEDIAKRQRFLRAPDAGERYLDVVSRTKLARVVGRDLVSRTGGIKAWASVDTESLALAQDFAHREIHAQEWLAYCFPAGLQKADDPEALRVLLIEPRKGQPCYHMLTAHAAKKDRLGFDTRKPHFGEFIAQSDRRQDLLSKMRDEMDREHRARVTALKQGTTDEPIAAASGMDFEEAKLRGLI